MTVYLKGKCHRKTRRSQMPPQKKHSSRLLGRGWQRPTGAQREVVFRRLNRVEYENTICELFQVRAEVAAMLPEDANAYGFDNIGEALGVSTELVEAYLRAADVAIDMVLAQGQPTRIHKQSSFTDGFRTRANANQSSGSSTKGLFIIYPT